MKKTLIVAVLALVISILFGISSDSIKPTVEKIYCKILPEECNETKANVQTTLKESLQKSSRSSSDE